MKSKEARGFDMCRQKRGDQNKISFEDDIGREEPLLGHPNSSSDFLFCPATFTATPIFIARMSKTTFVVTTPPGEYTHIGVVGSIDALGCWDLGRAVRLVPAPTNASQENGALSVGRWETREPLLIPDEAYPFRIRVIANGGRMSPNSRPLIWDQTSRRIDKRPEDGMVQLDFRPDRGTSDRGWVTAYGAGAYQLRVGQPVGSTEPLVDLAQEVKDVSYRVDLWGAGRKRSQERFKRLKYAHTGPLFDEDIDASEEDNAVLFILNAQDLESFEFRIDVSSVADETLLARGFVPASCLSGQEGTLAVALVSPKDLRFVGTFRASFIIVKEFPHPRNNLGGLQRRWRTTDVGSMTLDIGHRGSGASRVHGHSVRENTLLSFEKAALNHSDFIEFDVHLSADNEPVIHHDFQVKLGIAGEEIKVTVPSLSTEQLCSHSLALAMVTPTEHIHRGSMNGELTRRANTLKRTMTSAEEFIHSIFHKPQHSLSPPEIDEALPARAFLSDKTATLRDALRLLPPSLGFNIELKYPTDEEAAAMRARYYSRNDFVDAVLKVVFEEAKHRKLIFSSFDPDCATLLSLKQPRYPVLFLTCGGTKHFADPRMNSLEAALRFALASRLQGVVAEVQSVLDRLDEAVNEFHSRGLYLFTYGDLNNDINHYLAQRRAGVDAIIIDDVARIAHETKKKASKFLGMFGSNGSFKNLLSPNSSMSELKSDVNLSAGEIPIRELDRLSSNLSIVTLCPVGSPQDDSMYPKGKKAVTTPITVPSAKAK